MTDVALIALARRLGVRADDMTRRGRFLGDGSEETLRYTFDALDALDLLGGRIDAKAKEPKP